VLAWAVVWEVLEINPAKQASQQVALLLANLPALEQDLGEGAVVVLEPGRMRVRKLPIRG